VSESVFRRPPGPADKGQFIYGVVIRPAVSTAVSSFS
jgi:hypothetical protein